MLVACGRAVRRFFASNPRGCVLQILPQLSHTTRLCIGNAIYIPAAIRYSSYPMSDFSIKYLLLIEAVVQVTMTLCPPRFLSASLLFDVGSKNANCICSQPTGQTLIPERFARFRDRPQSQIVKPLLRKLHSLTSVRGEPLTRSTTFLSRPNRTYR